MMGDNLQAERVSWVGLGVNLGLVAFKYSAGIMGGSSAMVADATHSLTDLVTDGLAIVGFRISRRPRDRCHAYGHGRAETLLEALCGLSLLAAGAYIMLDGLWGIWGALRGVPKEPPSWLPFWAAAGSVVSKEILYRYTDRWARRLDNFALRAKALDHRSDALSSVGTLLGIGGAVILGGRFAALDSLAAGAVSLFIVRSALPILDRSVNELMEGALPEEVQEEIGRILGATPGVLGYHHVRTRRVGPTSAVEAHVLVAPEIPLREAHRIATRAERAIEEALGEGTMVTIHVEPFEERGGVDDAASLD
ncbi:cation diffusion facilitator family transporter [Thermanaerovibrio acidaminovorans DSM 6589]|uniref:Cation diffusion facilitator family transporter n=2 Tax=Thermanaerovibrio TaxID=81461 RepID=D1B7G4_THEAS|nr:cation diffusion facilitator family transporter [Thermanaerovibrio acidaminovorans DSM 6589]